MLAALWGASGFQVQVIISVTVMRAADAQPAVNPWKGPKSRVDAKPVMYNPFNDFSKPSLS